MASAAEAVVAEVKEEVKVEVKEEPKEEPMEVGSEEVNPEVTDEIKEDEEEFDYDFEFDEETELMLKTDPRTHVIAGPLIFSDVCDLHELNRIVKRCDFFELKFYKIAIKQKAETEVEVVKPTPTTDGEATKTEEEKTAVTEPTEKPKEANEEENSAKKRKTSRTGKKGYAKFSFAELANAYWALDELQGMKIPRVVRTDVLQCWMINQDTVHDLLHSGEDKIVEVKRKLSLTPSSDVSQHALYFGNLPKTITLEALKEFVPEAKGIHLPLVKGSIRGFAYVEFETKELADQIVESYKDKKLEDNVVQVRHIGGNITAHYLPNAAQNPANRSRRGGVIRKKRGTRGGQLVRNRQNQNQNGSTDNRPWWNDKPRRVPPPPPVWDAWGREPRRFPPIKPGRGRMMDPPPPPPPMGPRMDPWGMGGYGRNFRGYDYYGWMNAGQFSRPY